LRSLRWASQNIKGTSLEFLEWILVEKWKTYKYEVVRSWKGMGTISA